MRRYFLIALIIVIVVVTYFTDFFIKKERSFDENLRLKEENENLRAQIQKLEMTLRGVAWQRGNCLPAEGRENYLAAKVFSTYPFNIKNKITINVGEKQGVKKMMTATVGENLLLGQVVGVFENFSVIQTIFDPNWQLPARISKEEIDGLFQAGNEPKVVLIEKEKAIQIGDVVYSASQEFPYGLKIGEISEIKETAAGVFKEAILKIPFNVNELREVQILK
jgi:rod shape-determining protein MreC